MIPDWSSLAESRREYARGWEAIDQALYELCEKYRDHRNQAGVRAKLWLIGRTFATGIERVIPSDGTQGSSMGKLANHVLKHQARVDDIIGPLLSLSTPLTRQSLQTILAKHHDFVEFLSAFIKGVSPIGKAKAPHSFASKYLHFHCPLVPIFDGVASAELRTWVPKRMVAEQLDPDGKWDDVYAGYVSRFWHLYNLAQKAGYSPRVRDLEFFVLWMADKRMRT